MKRKRLRTLNLEGEDPIMHEGSEIAPSELIDFNTNLVGIEQIPGWGNEEKHV